MGDIETSAGRLLDLINRSNGTALNTMEVEMSPPVSSFSGVNNNTAVTLTAKDVSYSGNVTVGYKRLTFAELPTDVSLEFTVNDPNRSLDELLSGSMGELESQLGIRIAKDNYRVVSSEDTGRAYAQTKDVTVEFIDHYVLCDQAVLRFIYPIKPIDLTAPVLDPRVEYKCSSKHAYISVAGIIEYADIDVYPLEYNNGIPVGRHEPEPQRTNLYYNNSLTGLMGVRTGITAHDKSLFTPSTSVLLKETIDWGAHYMSSKNNLPVNAGGEYVTSVFAHQYSTNRNFAFVQYRHESVALNNTGMLARYRLNNAIDHYPLTVPEPVVGGISVSPFNDGFRRCVAWAKYDKASTYSTVTYHGLALGYGDTTDYQYSGVVSEGIIFDNPQLEEIGVNEPKTATSPIQSRDSRTTRASSFVIVDTLGKSGLKVSYSDGTSDVYDVGGINNFHLPYASNNWGVRYITEISYLD